VDGLRVISEAPTVESDTPELSYEQTVPRGLVHVRALSEVFITDSVQTGPDRYLLGVQLPRAHSMWSDRLLADHDPLVSVEVGRQAAFLVAHRYCGVPVGTKMFLERLDFRVHDLSAYADNRLSPPEGVVRAELLDRQEREGFLTVMEFRGELELGGRLAMEVSGRIQMLRRAEYEILRAQGRARKRLDGTANPLPEPRPAAPSEVGRADTRNMVIHPAGPRRFALIVDETHPAYFDHPHDHVTGSLLLEMYRQAAISAAHQAGTLPVPVAAVTGCRLRFLEFAELDALTECEVSVAGTSPSGVVEVHATLSQLGAQIADATIELTPPLRPALPS